MDRAYYNYSFCPKIDVYSFCPKTGVYGFIFLGSRVGVEVTTDTLVQHFPTIDFR